MAFPEIQLNLIYPYVCFNTKDKDPEKLISACNRFFGLLQLSIRLALQKVNRAESEILNFNFITKAIGRKVVILFDGLFSTITEDALRSLHATLGMFSSANLNLKTSLSSFIDLLDLIPGKKQSFAGLFSKPVPKKGNFNSEKVIDFLVKGFTIHS